MIREHLEIGQVVMVQVGPLEGLCGVLIRLVDGKATLEIDGGWFLVAPEETLALIDESRD